MRTCHTLFGGLFLALLFGLTPQLAPAQVTGSISNDTTWSGAVTVSGTVTVPSGKTLTVQAGAVVSFNSSTSLVIAGKLVANGSSGNLITFTSSSGSPAPGNWNGIEFQNTAPVGSVFNYCVVKYAGGGSNASALFYATGAYAINISNCTFQSNAGNAVNTRASSPRISSSLFDGNTGYGIYSDILSNFIIDSCTITNNAVGGIRTSQNVSSASITNSIIDTNGIGIFIDISALPVIQNNKIRKNTTGIQVSGGTIPTSYNIGGGNTISGNTLWGIRNTSTTTVKAERNYWGSDLGPYHPSLNPTGTGNTLSDYVDFQPWSIGGTNLPVKSVTSISGNTLWTKDSVIWVKNSITMTSGTLTINPGTIVKFAPLTYINIQGGIINANGKADSLIVFTSEKDDGYGGDSNGDGTTTGPNPGDWGYLQLYTSSNNSSVLNYCILKFAGYGSGSNVTVYQANPTISNIYASNSSYYGVSIYYSTSNIVNSTVGGNGYRGIYLSNSTSTITNTIVSGNGNIGILADGTSRLTIRKSTVSNNGSTGIHVDGGGSNATLILLDSCIVSNNNGNGVYNFLATGPQTFSNSKISGNNGNGIWCLNTNDTVRITADSVLNNINEGLSTSKAIITNNVIQGNRYPIALIGRVNSQYSGNTISGNQYNNAIALRMNRYEESFSDTLKTTFPSGMTSGTYVLIENSPGYGVISGQTLIIQPGVILKLASGLYFNVYGTLIANGTQANPIVFTSYRDASYGGKTNLASDTLRPAPNDWQYFQFLNATSVASVIRNCVFMYGGQSGYGSLLLSYQASLTTPIDSIVVRKSNYMGVRVSDALVTFTNCTIDSNATYGMYIEGSSPRAQVTVRGSTIQDNGSTGLQAVNNSTFPEVSNCTIRRNNGHGIGVSNGTISQAFVGNTVSNNNGHGIYVESPSLPATSLQFSGNTVTDNLYEGIFSTAARFIDNHILRNRYPIGVWGRLGNIYTDNTGFDGNVITGNTFNNAIALAGQSYAPLSDTLKSVFPQAITSNTYVAIENIRVNSGSTLVIQPGVIIKFQLTPPNYYDYKDFEVYGTLIAVGTPASPIIFTSWRDSTVGGKTALPTDYGAPAPGDYYYVYFANGSGASVVRNCQFKYAGRSGYSNVYFESNLAGLTFSNNLVRRSQYSGIWVNNTILTIDSTTVDSCGSYGVFVSDNAVNNVTLRNSKIVANGSYGVFGQGSAKFSVVSNCTITNNNATGLYIQNNTIPLSVIGNTVSNNRDHGIYILARNDTYDTLLTVAGNKVRNNGLAGIFSSRAHMVDDSVTNNRYAFGVIGQISLDGTTNAAGNYYQGGYFAGNRFPGVLVTEGNVFGRLGLSFPTGYTSKVVAVRGDLTVPTSTTLTVAPGTIIKFPREYSYGRFQVDGVLKSEGTPGNKIVFTSWKDDSYGGDSNADTSTTVPGGADWDMVYLNGASNNTSHILQTIVRYGGYTGNGDLLVYNNNAPIDSSFFSFSSNYGVYLYYSSSAITGNEIHHNPTGILVQGTSNPVISRNNFHDNTAYGLNNGTSNTIVATNNYWGDASGPFVNQGSDQNLTGTGNRIGINPGAVTYRNWLTARTGILLGDVSDNGGITAYDAALVLQYVVGSLTFTPSQLSAGDVSGDGSVTAFDASYILRYVVGLISGFPGLGKTTVDANIASSYEFKIEKGSSADEFEFVLRLNGTSSIFAAELGIDFDKNELSVVAMKKTALSDTLSSANNFADGKANVALAATVPVTGQGDFVRIVFKAVHGLKNNWQTALHLNKLVLNEVNLTSSTKDVEVSAQSLKGIPTNFDLSQNYPNPFNPSTTIEYQLPAAGRVSIKLYDLLGQEVLQLVDQDQNPGYYSMVWNGRNSGGQSVASGVYLYRIEVTTVDRQTFTSIKKMLLLK